MRSALKGYLESGEYTVGNHKGVAWAGMILCGNISKEIMLMGYYSVDKNIIISLDKSTNENKKEIVLNPDENNILTELENNSSNEAHLIKYKNNNKYYNGKKLHFIKISLFSSRSIIYLRSPSIQSHSKSASIATIFHKTQSISFNKSSVVL